MKLAKYIDSRLLTWEQISTKSLFAKICTPNRTCEHRHIAPIGALVGSTVVMAMVTARVLIFVLTKYKGLMYSADVDSHPY